jgi:hypothetical protein
LLGFDGNLDKLMFDKGSTEGVSIITFKGDVLTTNVTTGENWQETISFSVRVVFI